ncbi:hypothetical protein KJ359_008942 [Pestalotiopsis sp. 9143b]|nr:hypothetical protein KJ359_008942 [Pestalotiopsis sp. 9143b]
MASLHVAVLSGDKELARSLLEEGSDVNTYDQRLGTPLSIAVLKGYWSIAKVLHEHGADHTSDQFTSALIHSSIDNFNLPDLAATSGRAERSANRDAKLQDHGSASSRRGRRNVDSIGSPEAWQDAIESSDDELVGPNNVITTLYIRDGKLEETPTGTGPWPDRVPSESAGDDQDFCSILDIKDLNDDLQWVTYDILIRGPKLCRFISRVLEDYPGTSYHPSKITLHVTTDEEIDPAFVGLFHKSEDYVRICKEEGDHVTKAQAELLLKCLTPLWQLLHVSVDESKATGLMKWDQLWAIYNPGQTVVIEKATGLSAARVKEFNLTGMEPTLVTQRGTVQSNNTTGLNK